MTQSNQSELDEYTDDLNFDWQRYIAANYTDTNDYVALEAEMELLKYKLRKAEESVAERERGAWQMTN